MKKCFLVLLTAAALLFSGCSSSYRTMREPNVRFELGGNDFTLSEAVSGEATIVKVFGIDWAHLFKSKTGDINASVMGGLVKNSDSYAIYDILEKNPGYDFVMYPQVVKTSKGFPFIYNKTHVKVTARLGKLKQSAIQD